jgi:O-methyltransferase
MILDYLKRYLKRRGYEVVPADRALAERDIQIVRRVREFTMTSPERLAALIDAVRYVVQNGIAGDFAECGVWRGGSMMTAALTLLELGDRSRSLHLYDTFEGMPPPTDKDVSFLGKPAKDLLATHERKEGGGIWAFATRADVERNLESTGYPKDKLHFVAGKVEDTLPASAPERIALLRLDTDWYESTRHELLHLYPRLAKHGVLIIDDYGHWRGAQQATDEYFATLPVRPLLQRVDYTGRLAVKPE